MVPSVSSRGSLAFSTELSYSPCTFKLFFIPWLIQVSFHFAVFKDGVFILEPIPKVGQKKVKYLRKQSCDKQEASALLFFSSFQWK